MSNIAWCDLDNSNFLRIHVYCPNPKCKCQKQIRFSPKQFVHEGAGFKNKMKKIFKGSQTAWNKFLKTAVNIAAPYIGMALSAKTKNPKVGQATTNILKTISAGKISSLTDMHGHG